MIRRLLGIVGIAVVAALLAPSASPAGAGEGDLTTSGRSEQGVTPERGARAKTWRITEARCPAFNRARIRVRQDETGTSGTNYFRQVAQGQVFRNGFWQNRGNQFVQRSNQFANDFQNWFFHPPAVVFQWNSEFNFYHRILVRLQWMNNAGTPGFFGDDFSVGNANVFVRCP